MEPVSALAIAVTVICMFEYLLLDSYIIYHTFSRHSQGIKISIQEYFFLSLVLVLTIVRGLIALTMTIDLIYIVGILYCASYVLIFGLYSLICYSW
jgi:hypothetical protein